MGKLTRLKPTLGTIAPRLGYAEGDAKAADKSRNQLAPWRAWYRTARWQKLRHQVFVRDAYKCQRTGVLAIGKYPAPNSPVANHIRPHKGDPALFWDPDNIETITKAVHDSIVQAEERKAERNG
jgi:5-methylcytosine-specific restriction protein A